MAIAAIEIDVTWSNVKSCNAYKLDSDISACKLELETQFSLSIVNFD